MYEYAQIRKYPADAENNSFIIHDFCTFVTINFWRRNFAAKGVMLSSAAKNKGIGENIFAGMENPLVRAGNLWHNECAFFAAALEWFSRDGSEWLLKKVR